MIPNMSLIDILKNIKQHILFSWQKKKFLHVQSSMIHKLYYLGLCLFILLDHAFSIRTSFSRTNTFKIHSISTSKYLIHLITDDIKNYCIFGTVVSLLNVKPSWEKVINYHSLHSYTHFLHATYVRCET